MEENKNMTRKERKWLEKKGVKDIKRDIRGKDAARLLEKELERFAYKKMTRGEHGGELLGIFKCKYILPPMMSIYISFRPFFRELGAHEQDVYLPYKEIVGGACSGYGEILCQWVHDWIRNDKSFLKTAVEENKRLKNFVKDICRLCEQAYEKSFSLLGCHGSSIECY